MKRPGLSRVRQAALVTGTLALSWLLMMVVHESGHVIHAWLSGGKVVFVELRPWTFSRTDVVPNPHPLFVAWGGPIWGCLLPLTACLAAWQLRSRFDYLFTFFAGFCLIANGAYIGAGSLAGVGDASDMVQYGCPRWVLIAFGIPAAAAGLRLWHGLGPRFGLKQPHGEVDTGAVWLVWSLLAVVVLVELMTSWR